MATSVELDPVFRQALKFLHSSSADAAENIRKALDDVIKQKHGPNKMLINTLSKKYIAEESKATGSGVVKTASVRRSSNKSSDSSSSSPVQIIATTNTTSTTTVITTDSSGQTQEIPVIISLPDTMTNATIAAVDDNAMDENIHNSLFDDLSCIICRRIDFSAKNRLIECTKCNSLYHQECHPPQLKDSDLSNGQESTWCCSNCKVKKFKTSSGHLIGSPSKSNNSSSPTSSNSSNSDVIITGTSSGTFGSHSSSSGSKKEKEHSSSSSSKSKSSSSSRHHSHHHHHHSSSSSSHHSSKHERSSERSSEKSSSSSGGSSKSSSNSNIHTPNIHIISADKRLQNMKKKAAKTQESKRKK
ncbi:integrator complex subunit 12 [Contarinia nasturtii]|uniref:integrator complex subunit 12 n=1 Tax=Contarinia nasturtii TaxID=265458 RepID=UPI0012D45810|nr:integrator complex subunit 12 [Contarinia nasturtii]